MSEDGETIAFSPQITEYNLNKITGITEPETLDCEGAITVDGVAQVCSGHGSCVDAKCYCDNEFLGDACEIEAFSTAQGQPNIAISGLTGLTDPNLAFSPTFSGDEEVLVPYCNQGGLDLLQRSDYSVTRSEAHLRRTLQRLLKALQLRSVFRTMLSPLRFISPRELVDSAATSRRRSLD